MWLAGREQRRNKAGAMLPILAGGREPNARGRTMTKPLKPMSCGEYGINEAIHPYSR